MSAIDEIYYRKSMQIIYFNNIYQLLRNKLLTKNIKNKKKYIFFLKSIDNVKSSINTLNKTIFSMNKTINKYKNKFKWGGWA